MTIILHFGGIPDLPIHYHLFVAPQISTLNSFFFLRVETI